MVKALNITVDNWIADDIVEAQRPTGMNKSEWVRELLVKGWQQKEIEQRAEKARKGNGGMGVIYRESSGMVHNERYIGHGAPIADSFLHERNDYDAAVDTLAGRAESLSAS
jgi:hypothetical protein